MLRDNEKQLIAWPKCGDGQKLLGSRAIGRLDHCFDGGGTGARRDRCPGTSYAERAKPLCDRPHGAHSCRWFLSLSGIADQGLPLRIAVLSAIVLAGRGCRHGRVARANASSLEHSAGLGRWP